MSCKYASRPKKRIYLQSPTIYEMFFGVKSQSSLLVKYKLRNQFFSNFIVWFFSIFHYGNINLKNQLSSVQS